MTCFSCVLSCVLCEAKLLWTMVGGLLQWVNSSHCGLIKKGWLFRTVDINLELYFDVWHGPNVLLSHIGTKPWCYLLAWNIAPHVLSMWLRVLIVFFYFFIFLFACPLLFWLCLYMSGYKLIRDLADMWPNSQHPSTCDPCNLFGFHLIQWLDKDPC